MSAPLIIYNDDSCSLRYIDAPHTLEQVTEPLRYLKGGQVGALCWGMGDEIAYAWPSKVWQNYYEMLDAGHRIGLFDDEAGFDTTGENANRFSNLKPGEDPTNLMVSLHRQGIDYLPHLINASREAGISFYGSFRMNDCHLKSDPRGMLASTFWQEHQHYRLWDVTDGLTYYNAALDYSWPEVRQRRLNGIREALLWYDMDGVELDFCRNPYLFPAGEGWERRGILTSFLQEIRASLCEAERLWKRKKRLILRLPFDEKKQREAGMDISQWLEEGLMETVVMSALLNDYDQKIEPWASRCHEKGVAFYPSLEMSPAHRAPAHNHIPPETLAEITARQCAAARHFLSQGARGLYFFNYACLFYQIKRTEEEKASLSHLLKTAASLEATAALPKEYVFWKNLPLTLESARPPQYHQTLNWTLYETPPPTALIKLTFLQSAEANPHTDAWRKSQPPPIPKGWITYLINGTEIEPHRVEPQAANQIASGFTLGPHQKVTLHLPPALLRSGNNTLAFEIRRFPDEKDPYIYIYELLVSLQGRDEASKGQIDR